MPTLENSKYRMSLVNQFLEIRKRTEAICRPLSTEDYVVKVATFASLAKWHLAHTTWFFETFILSPFLPSYKAFHQIIIFCSTATTIMQVIEYFVQTVAIRQPQSTISL